MVYEVTEKNAFYTFFDGEISDLADSLKNVCEEMYGDRCKFYRISIERQKPDGSSWKVHEFDFFNEKAVNAVENHLNARRDAVRVVLGSSARDFDLEFIVCRARNEGVLSRFLTDESMKDVEKDDMAVIAVNNTEEMAAESRKFLESLE